MTLLEYIVILILIIPFQFWAEYKIRKLEKDIISLKAELYSVHNHQF